MKSRKEECYKALTKYEGLSIAKIAKKTNIPESTLYKWSVHRKKNKATAAKIKEIVELEDAQHQVPVDPTNGNEAWKLALLAAAAIGVVIWAAVTGGHV